VVANSGWAVAAAAAFLLAGCQTEPTTAAGPTVTAVAPAAGHDPAAAFARAADPVEPVDEDIPAAETASVPADLSADPDKLRGLPPPALRAALGHPTLRRHDHAAEIWQYYGDGCILDLFLYDERGAKRVVHYQLRSRSADGPVPGGCFSRMVRS